MFLTEAMFNYLNGFIDSRPQKLHNTTHFICQLHLFLIDPKIFARVTVIVYVCVLYHI